ncbi:hypothetical protein ACFLR7_03600 [Acidobacteriota bacterium]
MSLKSFMRYLKGLVNRRTEEKGTELESHYKIAEDDVYVTVVIGDGNVGNSTVKLDGTLLQMGEIDHLKVGDGPELIGKVLSIRTRNTHTNNQTDWTSTSYFLEGGQEEKADTLKEQVENPGDTILYTAIYEFVEEE